MQTEEKVTKRLNIGVTLVQSGLNWNMSQSIMYVQLSLPRDLKDMITSLGDCFVDGVTYRFFVKRATKKSLRKKIK